MGEEGLEEHEVHEARADMCHLVLPNREQDLQHEVSCPKPFCPNGFNGFFFPDLLVSCPNGCSMGEEDLEEHEVARAVRQYKLAVAAGRIVVKHCESARLEALWDW